MSPRPTPSLFALVDCNNFYASCERVFDRRLNGKPVVVLSNNDGCVIARSDEAKKLDIPMGAPFFKYEAMMKHHNVAVFSSNYTLYGDMSARVMDSLHEFTPDVEIYSIDEAFIGLGGFDADILPQYMADMRRSISQWTGIPTSVGIAPTKTLAKLACRIAKKGDYDGVFMLRDDDLIKNILEKTEIEDIWGISKRWGARLRQLGIGTGLDLRRASPKQIKKALSVVGERIVHELNGRPCLMLEDIQPKQQIMVSRSFGGMIDSCSELEQAVASYTARAAEKLRKQGSRAGGLQVFMRTNPFKSGEPQYSNATTFSFDNPVSDTPTLIKAALRGIQAMYKREYRYKQAGVMLTGLISADTGQISLLNPEPEALRNEKDDLMGILDGINSKMGRGTIFNGAEGVGIGKPRFIKHGFHGQNSLADLTGTERWRGRSQFCSPSYTTNWNDIPVAK
jgi:DNA polymerase V